MLGGPSLSPDHTLPGPGPEQFLKRVYRGSPKIMEIAGDASTRRFYRVEQGGRTAILAVHPEPLTRDAPLYSNHRVLSEIGAPVPKILDSDERSGSVLFEDFGDTTLQRHLAGGTARPNAEEFIALYRQACDLIVLLQKRGEAAFRPGDFAAANALDRDRFLFELDHFHRHFVVGLRGRKPDTGEEKILRSFYDDLASRCDRLPRVYCHRDFQSRNLMVAGGRLRIIDFQDARMGPYTYDPASLLRDSSLDLDEALVEAMLRHLAARLGREPEEMHADFDLMALQRNIKDLGTFGYMGTVRGRRDYLEYVPRTIASVRRALLADRRYDVIYGVLERFVLA